LAFPFKDLSVKLEADLDDLARANIAIEDEVATRLADEAARANKTLYGFSNESLEAVLKILRQNGSIEEIYPYWLQTKMSKEVDGMPLVNRGLVDSMVRVLYPKDSEALLKIFFDSGVLFGSYMKLRFKDLDDVWNLIKIFRISLPARLFEMERVESSSGHSYILRYISGISVETTVCFAKYFDGLFSCYTTNRLSRSSSSGMIELELRPELSA
jgi:hypothetical protein